MPDAVVVGSGPNGLTAACVLARAGMEVVVLEAADRPGGGARSAELTLPGLVHDVCSAIHPLGAASTAFTELQLGRFGLAFADPPIALAHPLDDGRAAVLHRSLEATAAGLGIDGPTWRALLSRPTERWDDLAEDLLRPVLHVPRHPVTMAAFGLPALLPATALAGRFRTPGARALFAGVAAHAVAPLERPLTAAFGMMLTVAGHAKGWPVAVGGSQAVTDALVARLRADGGEVVCGRRVTDLAELPPARITMLDVSPTEALRLAGGRLPSRVARAYGRWRYGPAAFKLDLAVEGGLPWTAAAARRAGTVHVGGSLEEIADAERRVGRGELPERPFVLVGQQYLADPDRARDGVVPVWAYAHVPAGYAGDVSDAILDQLERFAPGSRERIVGTAVRRPADLEAENPNYVGGDIAAGATAGLQVLARPRLSTDPYATGIPGTFLCSAATPPGAGVHGLCGWHAANRALREP